jgi:hypothetical protein
LTDVPPQPSVVSMSQQSRKVASPGSRLFGVALLVLTATGCTNSAMTEYRGGDAQIDGVLWRLVSSAEDPMRLAAARSLTPDADSFFDALPGVKWDGGADAVPDLDRSVAVIYDTDDLGNAASFSVFVSSGQRPDAPTDAGGVHSGPDSVFTCFGYRVEFGPYAVERAESTFDATSPADCPSDLVEAMPGVVAFAEPVVFSG